MNVTSWNVECEMKGSKFKRHDFSVQGMLCADNCAKRVKKAAEEVANVSSAEVDISNASLHVLTGTSDEYQLIANVVLKVFSAGYEVTNADDHPVALLNIGGMTCDHCSKTVSSLLANLPEVISSIVSLEMNMAFVVLSCDFSQVGAVVDGISSVGFDAEIYRNEDRSILIPLSESKMSECLTSYRDLLGLPSVACAQLDVLNHVLRVKGCCADMKDVLVNPWLKSLIIAATPSPSLVVGDYLSDNGYSILPTGESKLPDIDDAAGPSNCLPADFAAGSVKAVLSIKGMSCGACVSTVERLLRQHSSVRNVSVALITEKAEVELTSFADTIARDEALQELQSAIDAGGYEAALLSVGSVMDGAKAHKFIITPKLLPAGLEGVVKCNSVNLLAQHGSDLTQAINELIPSGSVLTAVWQEMEVDEDEYDEEEGWNIVKECGLRNFLQGPHWTMCSVARVPDTEEGLVKILEVTYDTSTTHTRQLLDVLVTALPEHDVTLAPPKSQDMFKAQEKSLRKLQKKLLWAVLLTLPVAMIMWTGSLMEMVVPGLSVSALVAIILVTPVHFICGWSFHKEAVMGLRHGSLGGMSTLISLGTTCAYLFGIATIVYSIYRHGMVEAYPDHVMTAAMLVAFMLLGKTMEVRAKSHTAFAIKHLLDCQAPSAVLIEGEWDDQAVAVTGKEREVAVELLHRGDIVKVIRGGVIPTDGVIVRGTGSVNESLITGESLPVSKSEGVDVIGGSSLLDGTLFIEVRTTIENSILQQIVKLVEGAQMRKAAIQQLADRFAGHFTSLILCVSFAVLVIWLVLLYTDSVPHSLLPENRSKLDIAITITLSTLVVACPCAMGLSTPTAIMVGTGVAARAGVLIKSGQGIEEAAKITDIVFDKTGTLTTGCAAVSAIYVVRNGEEEHDAKSCVIEKYDLGSQNGLPTVGAAVEPQGVRVMKDMSASVRHLIWLAMCTEKDSEHVIGRAIVDFAQKMDSIPEAVDASAATTATTGKGIQCVVQDRKVVIGSFDFLVEEEPHMDLSEDSLILAQTVASELQSTGAIIVYMAIDGAITGFFELSDQLRQEAASTIAALRTEGMKVWMVTGDHRRTADAIGKRVGLSSEYIVAGALPQVKLDFLVSRQNAGGRAVFVGDGINDAGALAQADVGIAMGGGTEVAIESADMVLMTANLTRVVTALSLSRSILRCIKRNLFWAIAYNVVAIPLAAGLSLLVFGSILPPWVAGGAMAMSSVSVVVSSLTLLRFRVDVNNE